MLHIKALLFGALLLLVPADGTSVHRDIPFPPLPDSIPSAVGWTHVERPPVVHCGDTVVLYWGCYTAPSRKLEVLAGLRPEQAWHTLEHEKVHMILRDAGLKFENMEDEQRIANLIADNRVITRLVGQ